MTTINGHKTLHMFNIVTTTANMIMSGAKSCAAMALTDGCYKAPIYAKSLLHTYWRFSNLILPLVRNSNLTCISKIVTGDWTYMHLVVSSLSYLPGPL
jgi:D-hexose-6-phosphate mutarotase